MANLRELALVAVDQLPARVARSPTYVRLRRRLSSTPARYEPPTSGARPRAGEWLARKLVHAGIDLVVDGFPGSGNSFVSNSLRDAAPHLAITSHFHFTLQLRRALALGVPAVVVIRAPAAAASSYLTKRPELLESIVLVRWLAYHRYVEQVREELAIVDLEEASADLEVILRRSPAVARLFPGASVVGQPRYRRGSRERRPLRAERPPAAFLLRRAETLYGRLAPDRAP